MSKKRTKHIEKHRKKKEALPSALADIDKEISKLTVEISSSELNLTRLKGNIENIKSEELRLNKRLSSLVGRETKSENEKIILEDRLDIGKRRLSEITKIRKGLRKI